jgi:hypothetical protein
MAELSPEIVAFYDEGTEAARLSRGLGRLELARMQELLSRYFPSSPADVGDIGGGPGAYACWLANQGHAVHLVDPIRLHVEQARDAWDQRYLEMVRDELATGQHRRPSGWRVFTTAYFHDPEELTSELVEAGLQHDTTLGIQGPGWHAPEFESMSQDTSRWLTLVQLAGLVETEPALSPHILAVAHKLP